MNHIKYAVALLAGFMLMIPAFPMPDDGQNSMMGSDDHHGFIKSIMGRDGGVKIVCLTVCKVMKHDGQKSMIGKNAKSMMGQWGKHKSCGCERSMMGHDGIDKSHGFDLMGSDGQDYSGHHSNNCENNDYSITARIPGFI